MANIQDSSFQESILEDEPEFLKSSFQEIKMIATNKMEQSLRKLSTINIEEDFIDRSERIYYMQVGRWIRKIAFYAIPSFMAYVLGILAAFGLAHISEYHPVRNVC